MDSPGGGKGDGLLRGGDVVPTVGGIGAVASERARRSDGRAPGAAAGVRARGRRADGLLLAGLTAAWWGAVWAVDPSGDFPANDDWAYASVVRALVEEGTLRSATVDGSGDSVTITPDYAGPYGIELVVSDGVDEAEPVVVNVVAIAPEPDPLRGARLSRRG
jgi:hypothetical protein